MSPGFYCSGQMKDSVCDVVWVSGLLMSVLLIEWLIVACGVMYGQAHVIDNSHWCMLVTPY